MTELFKKIKTNSLVTAILYTVLGAVLLFRPDLSTDILCTALGLILLICGAVDIVIFLANRDGSLYASSHLIAGVILAAVGIWIMNKPALIAVIIPRVIGILICIHGVSDIGDALSLQHNNYHKWGTALLLGILTLVLGAILIYDPFSAFTTVIRLIGAFLIYDGVSDIWIVSRVSKSAKQFKKDMEAEADAVDVDYTDTGK
jgi:Uncharacterized conserved protein